ncbi:MAG: AhpC/TSA family protein [Chromatiales bacterium]|nr:AhpC/TSA family protein [Chromatiales bacterium]
MGTLKDQIAAYDEEKKARVPEAVLQTMAETTEELKQSGIEGGALKVGDQMPDFQLPDQNGESRRLSDYLQHGKVVLNVYRGGWCPYCNMEMKVLHDTLPEITAQGARLIGLTPELPDKALSTAERHDIDIDILSDAGNQVAEQLGLVFELSEKLRPIYAKLGIDIPAYNGDESFKLPVPATYIVGEDGQVLYAFVNADYTQRMEPLDIVAALKGK